MSKSRRLLEHSVRDSENTLHFLKTTGKPAVVLIWLMGLVSAITVVCNLGYQEIPSWLLVPLIQESQIHRQFHCQSRNPRSNWEMMGVAWKLPVHQQLPSFSSPIKTKTPTPQQPCKERWISARPLDLWLVNFHAWSSSIAVLLTLNLSVGGWLITKYYHCDQN